MVSNYENIINAICERFQNHITPLKVFSWLENFDKSDWSKALITLNAFEYFTTKDIIKEFDSQLFKIEANNTNSNPRYALPVGKAGKSGLAMVYYLKKTNAFVTNKVKILDINELESIKEQDNLILVDDFSGSGETIISFHDSIKDKLPKNITISAITIAYLNKAMLLLKKNKIEIYGNYRQAAFSNRGSVFGYQPRMKAIREFCFKYGNYIYPEMDYLDKKTNQHPLGYSNSQALIGFEHAIPNNTLPIIWSDRKRVDTNEAWYPIFPRRTQAYIKESRDFKKTTAYWSSLLYKLNLESKFGFDTQKYAKYNLRILSILLLKLRRKNPISICQFLGINLDEYEEILKDGFGRSVFNEDGSLTSSAVNVVEEIRKKIKFEKEKYIKPELLIEEDMVYLPKKFLGCS